MSHPLDNMIWNAITTGNSNIAVVEDDVGCYQQDIAPFAGLRELNEANLQKLHKFIPAGRRVAISSFDKLLVDESKWQIVQEMECCQMVYEYPVASFTTDKSHLIVPLTEEHIPQMLELTVLQNPALFLKRPFYFAITLEFLLTEGSPP